MRDSLLLLLTALICSVLAWAFWHLAGRELILIFLILPTFLVIVDNHKLRKELKNCREDKEEGATSGTAS